MSITQLINYYTYGYRYDYERRGYEFKDEVESWDEVKKNVWTKEEREAQEIALKKQFGATAKEGL